ncbi:MAG: hypothetical protein WC251_03830 [Candidatus Izemoplasmatales bacterium]|jgi:hypothetical protein|nr:hypothetical protein [Dehalococcoidia bacterium]
MEHFFGLHKGHLTGKADRIAEKHNASHTNYTEPSGKKRGWFSCENLGEPFDRNTEKAVMADIEKAGGLDALRK